jgi:hypothetical protein
MVGVGVSVPFTVWLGTQLLGRSLAPPLPQVAVADVVRALWLGQGLAIALGGPRGLGPSWPARALGLGVLIAVPLPLLVAAWLAEATSGGTVARGIGTLIACAALAVLVAGAIEAAPLGPDVRRVAFATIEIGLATSLWAFRDEWLGWIAG